MGRPQQPLDRDGAPLSEFAIRLRELRDRADLTYDQLARKTTFARGTIHEAMRGRRLPSRDVTRAIVTACGGNPRDWETYRLRVKRALDPLLPGSMRGPVVPPWLDGRPAAREPEQASRSARPAEAVASGSEDWHIAAFSALLRLDGDRVEAWERRRIVSAVDGLAEIVTSVNVPRHPDDPGHPPRLESELVYGGEIQSRRNPYDGYFQDVIVLPRPLRAGQSHEYWLRLRLPAGQRMAPHYAHVPYRRSDDFELRVRFGPDRIPSLVWLLAGAPAGLMYRHTPAAPLLTPNRFGEVYASFRDLSPGLGYGISWQEDGQLTPGSRPGM
jgi:transcriptional regulator with XRE-family HTH domain